MSRLSCAEVFKQGCSDLVGSDPGEIVESHNVISLASKISTRHPFVFLPDFVDDLMNGMFAKHMMKKYHVPIYNNFGYVCTNLKMNGTRHKSENLTSMKENLSINRLARQYQFLLPQLKRFRIPLLELYHCNTLESLVASAVLDLKFISRNDLADSVLAMYGELQDTNPVLYSNELRESFDVYMSKDLDAKLGYMINQMDEDSYITAGDNGDISLPRKYMDLEKYAYDIIHSAKDGLSYSSLLSRLFRELPLFRIISNSSRLDEEISELRKNNGIAVKQAYWRYSPDSDQLFTTENYDAKIEHARKVLVSNSRAKFFGRRVTPNEFVRELRSLEVGDIDDLDDQVTRIAGLVLSDAAMLQGPHDDAREFDFMVDLANYQFRPEQEALMKKMNLQIVSSTVHCKVMVNEDVTLETLEDLKKAVPAGDQAVVFTCHPVDPSISEHAKKDVTVQVIGEDGIRDWCSITPTIPCRRHSVARVMYGDSVGKTVLIRSLNYESGLAVGEDVDGTESTYPIGSMKEVDLHLSLRDDYETATTDYFEFLRLLTSLAPNSFEDGIQYQITTVHDTSDKLVHNIEFADQVKLKTSIQMQDHHDPFYCECGHRLNESYHRTLCRHLVAVIDHMCRDGDDWSAVKHNIEWLRARLYLFREGNVERAINTIFEVLDPDSRSVFREYLLSRVGA